MITLVHEAQVLDSLVHKRFLGPRSKSCSGQWCRQRSGAETLSAASASGKRQLQ